MRKIKVGLILTILILGLAVVITPSLEIIYLRFVDFTNPHAQQKITNDWKNRESNFLIRKLGHPHFLYDGAAREVLAQKNDLTAKDILKIEQIVTSSNNYRSRSSALSVLFQVNPDRASQIASEIINSGEESNMYVDALQQMSARQKNEILPFLIQYAERSDGYKNGSIKMFQDLGSIEAIPILESMLEKSNIPSDPMVKETIRRSIIDAIKVIKEKNAFK